MKIALIGNPNSGKTTMYNALTGRNEKIGNWAGVTVDKKEYRVKSMYTDKEIIAVDLPGAYSMSAYTSEESITKDYILNENVDVIINIVDATNLNRSLFFTTQLLELNIPLVVALNKNDINLKNAIDINDDVLAKLLHCPVVKTISTSSTGLKELIEVAISQVGKKQSACFHSSLNPNATKAILEEDQRKRFAFVNEIRNQVETRNAPSNAKTWSDQIDQIITNKWLGIPIFAIVMFLVFQISQVWLGEPLANFLVSHLESFQEWIATFFQDANPLISAILVDGVLGGCIAVIGFLPLVMIMYFLIALLEDCGYMARVAVILDPIFKKVGLSGKSVIPFVISIGCAVPGIMASRTIRNEKERRATAMLACFMPCGAKIPVISLFAGAFFNGAGWVSTLVYFTSILIIYIAALIIQYIVGYKYKKSYFIIELPQYHTPSLLKAFYSMLDRGWAYIVKAATIILLCNMAIQIMQTFTWSFSVADNANTSILASISHPFSYILLPIVGVASWQLAASALTGFIAKENVVATLAICFTGLDKFINMDELALLEGSGSAVAGILAITKVAALAYLMFILFTPPCFAAIGAMNAEMKSKAWLWGGIGLQFGIGYTIAYIVYTIGTFIYYPQLFNMSYALLGAGIVIGFILAIIFFAKRNRKQDQIA